EVRVPAGAGVPARGPHPLRAQRAPDTGLAHQPGALVTADIDPGTPGGLPQLPGAIDLVVLLPQLNQPPNQLSITPGTQRRPPVTSRVVAARSHLQHLTD